MMGLRSSIIRALLRTETALTAASTSRDILDAISLMKPSYTGLDLIRIGDDGDGGYLVPNDLNGIQFCFSPGVSEVATFEETLADKYQIRSFLADASVAAAPTANPLLTFQKKFLGSRDEGDFMRLSTWINEKKPVIGDSDLLLQMDIEGAEYDILIDTDIGVLKQFRIMVIEFHNLDMLFERTGLRFLTPLFSKLTTEFAVAHIHPNNCKPIKSHLGIEVPPVMEFTFVRRDRISANSAPAKTTSFPHRLDRTNNCNLDDIVLPDIWWR
jgi:hypothetical protein